MPRTAVDITVPPALEEMAAVAPRARSGTNRSAERGYHSASGRSRVQQRTAKQSVDAPQFLEEIVELARTVEQILDVFGSLAEVERLDPQVRAHQRIDEQLQWCNFWKGP